MSPYSHSVTWTCPDVSVARPVLFRSERWRRMEVDDYQGGQDVLLPTPVLHLSSGEQTRHRSTEVDDIADQHMLIRALPCSG
jgi:hypothetical protein